MLNDNLPALQEVLRDCERLDGMNLPDEDGYVPASDDEKVDTYLRMAENALSDFPDARQLLDPASSWRRYRWRLIRAAALILNEVNRLDRIHAIPGEK